MSKPREAYRQPNELMTESEAWGRAVAQLIGPVVTESDREQRRSNALALAAAALRAAGADDLAARRNSALKRFSNLRVIDNMNHTEQARSALLQNLASALAHDAADMLEPSAGKPIDQSARDLLAADIGKALTRHMPTLTNVRHALDALPAATAR